MSSPAILIFYFCVIYEPHQVYFWDYSKPASQTRPHQNPSYILRTKRSLRALHFHPLGIPLILTAEVVDNKRSAGAAEPVPGEEEHPQPAVGGGLILQPVRGLQDFFPPQGSGSARNIQVVQEGPGSIQRAFDASVAAQPSSSSRSIQINRVNVAHVASTSELTPPAPLQPFNPPLDAPEAAGSSNSNMTSHGRSRSDMARRVLDMAGVRIPGMIPRGAALRTVGTWAEHAGISPGNQQQRGAPASVLETAELTQDMARLGFVERLPSAGPAVLSTHMVAVVGPPGPPQLVPFVPAAHIAPAAGAAAGGGAAALPQNIAAAAAAQGQIAAVASAAAAAVSAMERFGSLAGAAGPLATAGGSPSTAPFVDLAMCDPWGMQRIRSAGGTQTHAFPLEPQLLGSAYDLTWAWESQTTSEGTPRVPPQHQNAMLESQLMPLAMVSEQPCVVNLNVWGFNHRRPTSALDKARIQVGV